MKRTETEDISHTTKSTEEGREPYSPASVRMNVYNLETIRARATKLYIVYNNIVRF